MIIKALYTNSCSMLNIFSRTMSSSLNIVLPKINLIQLPPVRPSPNLHEIFPVIDNKIPFGRNILTPISSYIMPCHIHENPLDCSRNDVQNRRDKMKKHKKRKWMRKYISLVKNQEMRRQKKEEAKIQELFAFMRQRSEAWNPSVDMNNRLNLARRNGYYESDNPIIICKQGQEDVQVFTEQLIHLMSELFKINDPRVTSIRTHQAFEGLQKRISDCVEQIKLSKRNLIKDYEIVQNFLVANNLDDVNPSIPYKEDIVKKVIQPTPEVQQALDEKERLLKILEVKHQQLEHINRTMQKAVWEINDLTDFTLKSW